MIDYENSLKRFLSLRELAEKNNGYIEPTLYTGEINTIIKALEKQLGVSRVIVEGKYFCPKCKSKMKKPGFCICGQKVY